MRLVASAESPYGNAGLRRDPRHDRLIAVRVRDGCDLLDDASCALEPEACVDVLLRAAR